MVLLSVTFDLQTKVAHCAVMLLLVYQPTLVPKLESAN